MKAEIDNFKAIYLDRIAQLTGKTNQFNLTTKRFTRAEIEAMASNPNYIALYGRLADKFGDNGLVSVMIGEKHEESLHIILWLMSCRVLKRGMELSMMDALEKAKREGCKEIVGYYYPTKKNAMVENLYAVMGFGFFSSDEKGTVWKLMIKEYQTKGKHIKMSGVK